MKKKIYIVLFVLFIFNIFIFFSPTNDVINGMYESIVNFGNGIGEDISSFSIAFDQKWQLEEEIDKLTEENEQLKKQKDELRIENDTLKSKNINLNDTLDFESTNNQKIVMSNILYKKSNTPFKVLVIDKGEEDGIKEDQVVTYGGKMIGYISKVEDKQSEVMLLQNSNILFNIPVKISSDEKEIDSVIDSYSIQKDKLVITTLSDSDIGEIGDKVYTNGYTENQADGIYVGEIMEIDDDSFKKKYYVNLKVETYDYVEVITNESK